MYLVDTNVLSAGSLARSVSAHDLVGWMERNASRLYLSVITVAEIEDGIAKSRREGADRKAGRLAEWLETVVHLYSERILPIDLSTARLVGAMSDRARASGYSPGSADLAVAATANIRGYTILTRNVRHFRPLAIPIHDPFESLPAHAQ